MMGPWGSQRHARARAVVDLLVDCHSATCERVAGDLSLGDQSVLTFCRSLPPLSRCQMRCCPPNRALTAPAEGIPAPFLLSRLWLVGGIQFLPARVGCGVPGPPLPPQKNIGAKITTKPQYSSRTTRRNCPSLLFLTTRSGPTLIGRRVPDGRNAMPPLISSPLGQGSSFVLAGILRESWGPPRRRALPPSHHVK